MSNTHISVIATIKQWLADGRMRMLLTIFVTVLVALSVMLPSFRTVGNLNSMALQISDLGILSLGMMLSMIVAGIDLSVVAVANFCSIVSALVMQRLGGADAGGAVIVVGMGAALLVGAALGALNGLLVGYLHIPAILVTLATMTLWQGAGTAATGGVSISDIPVTLTKLGTTSIVGVPVPVLVLILAIILVWLVLIHTPTGFKAYLYGSNPKASLFSGVDNAGLNLRIYSLSGLLSGMAGTVIMMRTFSASPSYGSSYVLLCILIAVLGGVSVTGGSGRVSGIVLALITLQMLSTGFNMLLVGRGNSNFFKSFAWGGLLLVVVSAEYSAGLLARYRARRMAVSTAKK